jgi:hypothetical protein
MWYVTVHMLKFPPTVAALLSYSITAQIDR